MFAKIYHRFFDDILIYSKTITDYLFHLENTFQILVTGKFSLKLSKCMFAQKQLEYLGHVVAGDGVRPVPEKFRPFRDGQHCGPQEHCEGSWVSPDSIGDL